MNRAFILLGSNVDKEKNMPLAVEMLAARLQLLALATVYETAAVGAGASGIFLNTAALALTPLGAIELKVKVLRPIEAELGRQRLAHKNAPRSIDLDIVLFNDEVLTSGGTHIPDPDLLRYAHAIVPVAELAPEMAHPESGEKLAAIAQRVLVQAAATGETPLRPLPEMTRLLRQLAIGPDPSDRQ